MYGISVDALLFSKISNISSMFINPNYVQALETDLLNPDPAVEQRKHKLKRLVQSPNSFFMDVKCPGCYVM